jgi:hypothetical protein
MHRYYKTLKKDCLRPTQLNYVSIETSPLNQASRSLDQNWLMSWSHQARWKARHLPMHLLRSLSHLSALPLQPPHALLLPLIHNIIELEKTRNNHKRKEYITSFAKHDTVMKQSSWFLQTNLHHDYTKNGYQEICIFLHYLLWH